MTGRIKHFISAFGEHVIGEEVEQSIMKVAHERNIRIIEFTVAPMVEQGKGQSYHEWFIEFEEVPASLESFAEEVDNQMRLKNIYYEDLRKGNILKPLSIRPLVRNAFIDYMRAEGKLGGQNKVPRLSNDRNLANRLEAYVIK